MKNILVTGGAGFIGSNFVNHMVETYGEKYTYVVYDKMTYAANMDNLIPSIGKYEFVKGDICDLEKDVETLKKYNIDAVVHFAAESHVDNSIKRPLTFTENNVLGTNALLEACRKVWGEGSNNRFVHVSTDEVYGTLGDEGYFVETLPLAPNSPYSASKAGSDLVARAYEETFKMNVCITRCSNNYGPNQHEEKLIPLMIKKAKAKECLPIYGTGKNVRDWLYVEDHCIAIDTVLHKGIKGEVYNIGGNNEKTNLDIVTTILKQLGKSEDLITYVEDRKGHDYRYAIDSTKIKRELGWEPSITVEQGLKKTIDWYTNKEY
ncbi:MAG: dTDP-glucose 4,6-dehydratase [Clostridia bacterium]